MGKEIKMLKYHTYLRANRCTFVFLSVISYSIDINVPEVTSSSRLKHRKNVLLPEPDGPITQTTSFSAIVW